VNHAHLLFVSQLTAASVRRGLAVVSMSSLPVLMVVGVHHELTIVMECVMVFLTVMMAQMKLVVG